MSLNEGKNVLLKSLSMKDAPSKIKNDLNNSLNIDQTLILLVIILTIIFVFLLLWSHYKTKNYKPFKGKIWSLKNIKQNQHKEGRKLLKLWKK